MLKQLKKVVFLCYLFAILTNKVFGVESIKHFVYQINQTDSLIKEKSIVKGITQLELLVLYQNAWLQKHSDSINVFKYLALLNAELDQPEDALFFTEKYIQNTQDLTILNNEAYKTINKTNEYEVLREKYMTRITVFSFMFFCVALIGFYFVFVINFIKKGDRNAKFFIGCFVGVHSLFILEFTLFITNLQLQFPHTYRISSAVALLFGPLLFFYFKSIQSDYKLRKIDLLHFAPTIILILFLFPIYALPTLEKLKFMTGVNSVNKNYDFYIFSSKALSLSVYAFFIRKLIFENSKPNYLKPNNDVVVSKWKKNIFRIHLAYILFYLIYGVSIFDLLGTWSSFSYYIQVGLMSLLVMYIVNMSYAQPEFFKKSKTDFIEKYQKSGLTNALSEELKENLIKLLVQDKVFKENNINLEILSNRLNTTRHNTSQIINEHFGMNFFELINTFRIKEAVDILKKDIYGSLNIIDIAYEVGYNNKVTFNKAFKKEMSVTPSEYIQSQIKNNP